MISVWLSGRPVAWSRQLAWGGGGGLLVLFTLFGAGNDFRSPWTLVRMPLIVAASSALVLVAIGWPVGTRLSPLTRGAVLLGRMSYGLYVLHVPSIRLVRPLGLESTLGVACLSLLITISLATVSYYALELRFLQMKSVYSRN